MKQSSHLTRPGNQWHSKHILDGRPSILSSVDYDWWTGDRSK